MRKLREKIKISIAEAPRKAVLVGIMLFNIALIALAAGIISILSRYISGLAECGFWEAVYYTVTMMLDAGCIESVIEDVGTAGAFAVIICITVVIVGMVFFSGAVIGYVTNLISDFIESENSGKNRLVISDHIVIINWNSRAAEIINEFLYEKNAVSVVVFVQDNRDEIRAEIKNRLKTTVMGEAKRTYKAAEGMSFFEKRRFLRENLLKDRITCIVREGDVAAATDLDDICISRAKAVIILDNGEVGADGGNQGNIQTVKTLMQVSEISKANRSQRILAEVSDQWTEDLVRRIIELTDDGETEKIIPVSSAKLLGETYAQIAIVPELNGVYYNFFSGNGAHFFARNVSDGGEDETEYIGKCLASNCRSVPLTLTETDEGKKAFFMAKSKSATEDSREGIVSGRRIRLREEGDFKRRNIIVLGHNSHIDSMMEGFDLFIKEQKRRGVDNPLNIVMVDSAESIDSHGGYKDYPYVEALAADIYDDEAINRRVAELSENVPEETTVLILSDDSVEPENADADVLTYLIYIQGQIREREKNEPDFDREKLDVIVEILNPKNEDIVRSYGADRLIIGNRYLSRVISQISLGEAFFELYADGESRGKEIYVRTAENLFAEIPAKCTAAELIRTVFESGDGDGKPMLLGYIRGDRDCVFFDGDQSKTEVELRPKDVLIIFGKHGNPDR